MSARHACGSGMLSGLALSLLAGLTVAAEDRLAVCRDLYVVEFTPGHETGDDRILTQTENGRLVILHLDGRIEPLLEVDIGEEFIVNPHLYRDRVGRLIYEGYLVDVDNRSATRLTRKALGFGFEIEYGYDRSDSAHVWFNDKPIYTFLGGGGEAIDDYLCVDVCERSKNQIRRPAGLAVWSRETEAWTTLDVAWLADVIGWTNPIE